MRKKQVPRKAPRYRSYSPEALINAYKCVSEMKIPVERAAQMYGVPPQTLRDRVKGHINAMNFSKGGETMFSREEEEPLVEYVETMAQLGYGLSNMQLKQLGGELAQDLGKKKTNKHMSNNWLYGFLCRWKGRLASVNPRRLDSNRAKCCTPEAVNNYFNNLEEVMNRYNFQNKPENIYNLDETGLQPDHRPCNVIANTSQKVQGLTSPRSTTTTLISCINAIGNALPPYFVFKGKRRNDELVKGASPGTKYSMSESGWSNAEVFQTYLKEHFLQHARPSPTDNQPILLIYDGHSSHKMPHIIKWAKEQNIILFVLPAHASHLLQPLDVSVFGPFKKFYYYECSLYMRRNIGRIVTRFDICELACRACSTAMSPKNIMAGFRKTGIFPFTREAIKDEQLFTCESFREDQPIEKVTALKRGKEAVEDFLRKKEATKVDHCNEECSACKKKKYRKVSPSGIELTSEEYANKTAIVQPDTQIDPKPSTSGLKNNVGITSLTTYSDSDSDTGEEDESEKCCVCGKLSPPKS